MKKIRIGVSACLLGEKVRYNGGDKQNDFIKDTLGRYFEWVPLCPEVEMGLGIPRESMRLVRRAGKIRMETVFTKQDQTSKMKKYLPKKLKVLGSADLCGILVKKNSPSCGMERVRVYGKSGIPSATGVGLFAEGFRTRFPLVPMEEEGRLENASFRENWIGRVFAYRRWKDLSEGKWTTGQMVSFHSRHKMTLLAHSPVAYRELGRLIARIKELSREEFIEKYGEAFMVAMAKPASVGRHVNVLEHMAGWFKKNIDTAGKAELKESISDFQKGLVSLDVPLALIRHYVRKYEVSYLKDQAYLNPHPKELALRKFL